MITVTVLTANLLLFYVHADVDECEIYNETILCQQICINTIGSFLCACKTGFILHENGVNCTGKPMHAYIIYQS